MRVGISIRFCLITVSFILSAITVAQDLDRGQILDEMILADSLLDDNQDSLAKISIDKIPASAIDRTDTELLLRYQKLLGDYFLGTSRYRESVDAYEPLLTISTEELDRDLSLVLARAINDLGISYMKIGAYDEAISAHIQSQAIYDLYDEPQGGSYNYNNIAIIYTKLKKIDSALWAHNLSLEYAELANDTLGIGFNNMNMGILYVDNNDLVKALFHFQEALRVFGEIENERMVNAVNRRLGTFYSRIRDYESALAIFKEVLDYYEKRKSDAGLGGIHVSIAEALLDMDRIDTAKYHIDQSIYYYEPTGYVNGMSKALHLKGRYFKYKGLFDQSLENYQQSLELGEGKLHGMTMSNINGMADIYLMRGEYGKVIEETRKGLEIVNYSASPGSMGDSYMNLSKAYKALGNSGKSLEFLEKYNGERSKVFDDEQMFQMARTEYKNQLDREAALREAEQRQKDLVVRQQLTREKWIRYSSVAFSILILIIAFFAYNGYRIKKAANEELAEKNHHLKELRESEKKLSEETIATKERELATMAMASHEKNTLLSDLEQKVSFIEARIGDEMKASLKEMKKAISDGYSLDKSWDSFLHRFEDVHPQFFDKLKDENPVLTVEDLKLSAYLKIGMSNKEIANVTHLTLGSVKSKINRLKKKLSMAPEDSLRDFMLKYA